MRVTGVHQLSKQAARDRLNSLVQQLGHDHASDISEMTSAWQGDELRFAFKVRGFHIQGKAEVTDSEWQVEAGIPLLLRPFERTISTRVQEVARSTFGTDAF